MAEARHPQGSVSVLQSRSLNLAFLQNGLRADLLLRAWTSQSVTSLNDDLPQRTGPALVDTGVEGLDAVLCGGLSAGGLYLVEVTPQLHELLGYLGSQGATTLLLMTQHHVFANDAAAPLDATNLADAVVLLRYFEAGGEIRQAISLLEKRTGSHERTIRELRFDRGMRIGEPLRDFHDILSGTPHLVREARGRASRGRSRG